MSSNLILFIFCMSLLLLQLLRTKYRYGLSNIPGPFSASFCNLWKILAVYQGDMPRRNIKVHEKYGPVVRIGPNHISFASPEALHIIHGSRQAFPKSDFYKPTSPVYEGKPLLHLFSIQNTSYHTSLKKNIAGLYTKSATLDLEPQVDNCLKLFLSQIQELCSNSTRSVDMSLWVHLFAFDCLGEINVSKKFGFLESGTDVRGMIGAADRILHMTGLYGQAPFLLELQRIIKYIWGVKKTNPLLMFTFAQVNDRLQNPKPYPDMLNNFLKLQQEQPNRLSIEEITGALYINLMAGHDVLAITLRAIFYYLARSPRSLRLLREEIAPLNNIYSLSEMIPYKEISTLSYLDAIIHEALRVHANTGLILERVVPAGGAMIDGYSIPGNTIVGVNAWVIHRDPRIYGEDVNVFRPERWMNITEEKLNEMKRNLFSFGAGPRMCIGRNIAMMQIGKVVVEFYRRFETSLENLEKEWKVIGSWVTKQTEMNMIVTSLEEKVEI